MSGKKLTPEDDDYPVTMRTLKVALGELLGIVHDVVTPEQRDQIAARIRENQAISSAILGASSANTNDKPG